MQVEKQKLISKTLATVTLSSFLGFLAARLSGFFENVYDIYIGTVWIASLFLFLIYYVSAESLEDYFWSKNKLAELRSPLIGILRQEGCPLRTTRFTPEDWYQRFSDLRAGNFRLKIISVKEISSQFTIILNPYGEIYPEIDLVKLPVLKRIKEYISDGGTFVNVAGLAFFYGYDGVRRREATLGKELVGYQQTTMPSGRQVMTPTWLWPETYAFSLADTPLENHFKVLTTTGQSRTVRVTQEDIDRTFFGDIVGVGEIDQIEEFRAARDPLRNAQPLLRARWPNEESSVTVYPIVAIPCNRGCLILAGISLNTRRNINGVDLDTASREKIIRGLINLVTNQKNGLAPYDWRKSIA